MSNGAVMRQALLETIQRQAGNSDLQIIQILKPVAEQLNIMEDEEAVQALLTMFHDLFRTGQLAWGLGIYNAGPPYFHITERGRRALKHLSRDPMNPEGYMANLSTTVTLGAIPNSYITEALNTYNADCHKATAVLVGCAAEATALEVRDDLVNRMTALGQTVPEKLKRWKIGEVLTSISNILDPKKASMPQSLKEAFEAFWPAFTGQIRFARNDAGHPSSVDPVTPERVHASLLIFPEQVKLAATLRNWINTSYT